MKIAGEYPSDRPLGLVSNAMFWNRIMKVWNTTTDFRVSWANAGGGGIRSMCMECALYRWCSPNETQYVWSERTRGWGLNRLLFRGKETSATWWVINRIK